MNELALPTLQTFWHKRTTHCKNGGFYLLLKCATGSNLLLLKLTAKASTDMLTIDTQLAHVYKHFNDQQKRKQHNCLGSDGSFV